MKKHAIVLAALIGAASAQAQVYGTIAAGSAHANLDCTGATACDKSDTAVKVMGGYDFGSGLSLEAGYISFGKFRAGDSSGSLSLKPTAILLGGAYAIPFNADWGMNVRLGVAQVKTKADAVSGSIRGSISESKAKAYAGVGVTYAVSQTVKIELAADSTQAEIAGEKGTLRLITLGATFAF